MHAASRRELGLVALGIALLLAIPLIVPKLRLLFLKSLWLDELHTWILSRDMPGPHLVSQLRQGADFNPPLLYAIDWVMRGLLPWAPDQLVLRLTSVLAVGVGMFLLYRISRQRLGALPSLIGAVAVLGHSNFLGQLHEARFYAPWFLLAVSVAWSLQSVVDHPRSWWRHTALALLTAATCLIHYFGIFSIACLTLGFLLTVRSPARAWRALAAVAVGSLALGAWLPVYLAQRTVLTVPTWIPDATPESAVKYLLLYLGWLPYAAILFAAAGHAVLFDRKGTARETSPTVAQAATIGLIGLPFLMVVLSFAMQPALLGRYAAPAVAAMACLVAIASARLPLRLQQLILVGALAAHGGLLAWKLRLATAFQRGVNASVVAVNTTAGDPRPVLASDRLSLYPAALSAANRNGQLAFLVLPTDSLLAHIGPRGLEATRRLHIVERDAAIAHNTVFGFPTLIPLETMRRTPSFFVLLPDSTRSPHYPTLYGAYRVCRVHPRLLLFTADATRRETVESIEDSPACAPGEIRGAPPV